MADWLVAGVGLIGMLVVFLVVNQRLQTERVERFWQTVKMQEDIDRLVREHEAKQGQQAEDWEHEMLRRLLDAALPVVDVEPAEGKPGSDAEYEAPDPVVSDWTDPFFGIERPLVGGLRPGEGIPGIDIPGIHEPLDNEAEVQDFMDGPPLVDDLEADWQRVGEKAGDEWLDRQ